MQIWRCLESESGDDLSECVDAPFAGVIRSCSLHRCFTSQLNDINGCRSANTDVWNFWGRYQSAFRVIKTWVCFVCEATEASTGSRPNKRPVIEESISTRSLAECDFFVSKPLNSQNSLLLSENLVNSHLVIRDVFLEAIAREENFSKTTKEKTKLAGCPISLHSSTLSRLFSILWMNFYERTYGKWRRMAWWRGPIEKLLRKNFSGVLVVMPSCTRVESRTTSRKCNFSSSEKVGFKNMKENHFSGLLGLEFWG